MSSRLPSTSGTSSASDNGAYEDERRGIDEAEFSNALTRLQQLTTDLSQQRPEPLQDDTIEQAIRSYTESQGRFIQLCGIVFSELAFTVLPMLLAEVINDKDRHQLALVSHKALEMLGAADCMTRQDLVGWAHSLKKGFDLAFGHSPGHETLLRDFLNHVLEPLSAQGKRIWRELLFAGPVKEKMPIGYDAESSGYGSDDEASSDSSADTLPRPATPSNATGSPTIYVPHSSILRPTGTKVDAAYMPCRKPLEARE
jgi:hypothetical protein